MQAKIHASNFPTRKVDCGTKDCCSEGKGMKSFINNSLCLPPRELLADVPDGPSAFTSSKSYVKSETKIKQRKLFFAVTIITCTIRYSLDESL